MTLRAIAPTAAEHLFTTIRDTDFAWTLTSLPQLLDTLAWTVAEEVAGKGLIADTPWQIPDADAMILYTDDTVDTMQITLTDRATDTPDAQDFIQDTFAELTARAAALLGPPTSREPGESPKVTWRRDLDTLTLQNARITVLAIWSRTAHQDELAAARQDTE